jgi:LmbE family N-acetylglucosaminyl deacetylase
MRHRMVPAFLYPAQRYTQLWCRYRRDRQLADEREGERREAAELLDVRARAEALRLQLEVFATNRLEPAAIKQLAGLFTRLQIANRRIVSGGILGYRTKR